MIFGLARTISPASSSVRSASRTVERLTWASLGECRLRRDPVARGELAGQDPARG